MKRSTKVCVNSTSPSMKMYLNYVEELSIRVARYEFNLNHVNILLMYTYVYLCYVYGDGAYDLRTLVLCEGVSVTCYWKQATAGAGRDPTHCHETHVLHTKAIERASFILKTRQTARSLEGRRHLL